eukprot:724650-Pleurochrysis_carterae.AAC.3
MTHGALNSIGEFRFIIAGDILLCMACSGQQRWHQHVPLSTWCKPKLFTYAVNAAWGNIESQAREQHISGPVGQSSPKPRESWKSENKSEALACVGSLFTAKLKIHVMYHPTQKSNACEESTLRSGRRQPRGKAESQENRKTSWRHCKKPRVKRGHSPPGESPKVIKD